jgi:hypothetical protein
MSDITGAGSVIRGVRHPRQTKNHDRWKRPVMGLPVARFTSSAFEPDTTTTIVDPALAQLLRRLRFLRLDPLHWEANQTVQRTGASRYAEWRCGRSRWLAPVADLCRWPSQTDQESRHMKATGHGYIGCEVYVVAFRPRPDDNDDRCDPGSVLASSVFLAARSTSLGGQPVGPANGRQLARRVGAVH